MKKVLGGLSVILLIGVTIRLVTGQQLNAEDELSQTTDSSLTSVTAVPSSEPPAAVPAEERQEDPIEEIPVIPENSTSFPTEESVSGEVAAPETTTDSSSEESVESSTGSSGSEQSSTTVSSTTSTTSSNSTSDSTSTTQSTGTSSTPASSTTDSTSNTSGGSSTSSSVNSTDGLKTEEPVESSAAQSSEPIVQPMTPSFIPADSGNTATVVNPPGSIYSGVTDFSNTSTLDLDPAYKTTDFADSELKGFELPLLSSFEDTRQAALIYEAIKQLSVEQVPTLTNEQFVTGIYQRVLQQELTNEPTPIRNEDQLTAGDVLYIEADQAVECAGIYLGDGYLLSVKETSQKDEESETEERKSASDTDEKEKEAEEHLIVQQTSERDVKDQWLVQQASSNVLTTYGKELLKEYPASMDFTASAQTQKFVETIGKDAQKLGEDYDVFASVMIAQAILESGSGTSGLSVAPYYNLFGIKGSYKGNAVTMATQEDGGGGNLYTIQSAFRVYPNYAASLGDYVELIRGGISGSETYYQEVWRSKAKNYLRASEQLTGKYATDTSYHRKLASLIAVYHLTEYDKQQVQADTPLNTSSTETGIFIKGKSEIPAEYAKRMTYPDYDGVNYNTSGSYPVGQCTWYAFNRVAQLGKRVDNYMGNGGEWGTKGRALGYEISQKPKAGRLISFTPGVAGSDPRYGHVAFVEAVGPEGILISEGNVYGGTTISYRVIPNDLALSNQVSYVTPKAK